MHFTVHFTKGAQRKRNHNIKGQAIIYINMYILYISPDEYIHTYTFINYIMRFPVLALELKDLAKYKNAVKPIALSPASNQ